MVFGSKPAERIIQTPPLIAVEVFSPDDRAGDLEEKIADYLAFGVQYVWAINPDTRRAYSHTPTGIKEAKDGVLRAESANIEIPLSEIFQ